MQGGIAKQADKQLSGIENWQITRQQIPYIDFFQERKADLVYLTADSPHELSELDSSKLYIIGGIVDRNRHKNICYNKAVSQVTLSNKYETRRVGGATASVGVGGTLGCPRRATWGIEV